MITHFARHAILLVLSITSFGFAVFADGVQSTGADASSAGGRIALYETRRELAASLRHELESATKDYAQISEQLPPSHTRVQAAEQRVADLATELQLAQSALATAANKLSREQRELLIDEFRTKLEVETAGTRSEIASLRLRYKPKHPSLLNALAKLKSLEESLTAFLAVDTEEVIRDFYLLERLQIQSAIFKKRAELTKLRTRYRAKHPQILAAQNEINALSRAINESPSTPPRFSRTAPPPVRPLHSSIRAEELNLLKEEIQLVSNYVAGLEQTSRDDSTTTTADRDRYQLELINLQQRLAEAEGRKEDHLSLVDDEINLLNGLADRARTPKEKFLLRRQVIDAKREKLDLKK